MSKKTKVKPYRRRNKKKSGTHRVSGHTREINQVKGKKFSPYENPTGIYSELKNSDWVKLDSKETIPYRWELEYMKENQKVDGLNVSVPIKKHSSGRKLSPVDIVMVEVVPTNRFHGTSLDKGDTKWLVRGEMKNKDLVRLSDSYDTPEKAKEKALEIIGDKDD